jgi:16S rRNA C967 or C1407 C5-methylase (RsmB/RsmF family)
MDYRAEVVKKSSKTKASLKKKSKKSEFWLRMEAILQDNAECSELQNQFELFQKESPKALRLNPLRKFTIQDVEGFLENKISFEDKKLDWCQRGFFLPSGLANKLSEHPLIGTGGIYIQEPSAMEPVEVLNPQPGELILDLCAAPGGKASQIGEKLNGYGWLVANDPVRARAERLDAILARHGIINSSVFALAPENLLEKFPTTFDGILVDAPCGGESLFAKRVDHRTDIRDADVRGNARRQFLILNCAAEMVKPGGRIVYSTCTYSKEENENVVSAFLESHSQFSLILDQRRWPHKDNVAGGYWAHLVHNEPSSENRSVEEFHAVAQKPEGLMRHGIRRWNHELDEYLIAMSPWSAEETLKRQPQISLPQRKGIELSLDQVVSFLKGMSLSSSIVSPRDFKAGELGIFTWQKRPIGVFKFVGDRFNNLLPRLLRS